MKKLYIYIFLSLIFLIIRSGFSFADSGAMQSEIIDSGDKFITTVELGTANADAFITVIKKRNYLIDQISHSAVANYMEALANEGMLKLIPMPYYSYDDIRIALYVVFEDRKNVTNNWEVFQNVWLESQICQ